jgi:hypothetical protein
MPLMPLMPKNLASLLPQESMHNTETEPTEPDLTAAEKFRIAHALLETYCNDMMTMSNALHSQLHWLDRRIATNKISKKAAIETNEAALYFVRARNNGEKVTYASVAKLFNVSDRSLHRWVRKLATEAAAQAATADDEGGPMADLGE